jgi:hypothetical protein
MALKAISAHRVSPWTQLLTMTLHLVSLVNLVTADNDPMQRSPRAIIFEVEN